MSDKKNDDYVVPMPGQGYELKRALSEAESQRPMNQHSERPSPPASSLVNSPTASILGYCLASISMTVVNKYIVSGSEWNLMFLYLAIQVCRQIPTRSCRSPLTPASPLCALSLSWRVSRWGCSHWSALILSKRRSVCLHHYEWA